MFDLVHKKYVIKIFTLFSLVCRVTVIGLVLVWKPAARLPSHTTEKWPAKVGFSFFSCINISLIGATLYLCYILICAESR